MYMPRGNWKTDDCNLERNLGEHSMGNAILFVNCVIVHPHNWNATANYQSVEGPS